MLWIIIIILVVLIGATWISYNGLVRKRNRVEQSESDIDVQLKRRYDLISQAVKVVQGYAKHEKETLDAVVKARADAMKQTAKASPEARQSENILEGALKSLFALAENYPDLKASANFVELQKDITDSEDKIQAARRFYNNSLRAYNDYRQQFPGTLFASMFNFGSIGEYFDVSETEAQVPQIDL